MTTTDTTDQLLADLRASMRQTIEQVEATDLECQNLVREALAAKDAEIIRLKAAAFRLTAADLKTEEAKMVPAEQQFILAYAALCETHGLVLHTYAYGHEIFLGEPGGRYGEPSDVVLARLILATPGKWCPQLRALLLRLARKLPPYVLDGYEQNISENGLQRTALLLRPAAY